jgi:uncharacterized glyoxalase superfamily protein PhnB
MSERALIEQLDQAITNMLAGSGQTTSGDAGDAEVAGLMPVASLLRLLPNERFKASLGRELQNEFQRRRPMTTSTRTEYATIEAVTPFISVPDADRLIDFMKQTFGAEETSRHAHGTDGFVASVRIADSDLLVMGGESLRGQESPAALHVYVKDCEAVYQRALREGAVTLGDFGKPADRPYGEHAAFVTDPFGNYWFIATRHGENYVGTGLKHVTPSLLPAKAAPVLEFMKNAFGARVEGAHEIGGKLMHAFVHVGQAVLEIGEAGEKIPPFAFYMHTDDVDAVYERAVQAGGVSILPPADQGYEDRLGIVQDPGGNRWFVAKTMQK